MAFSAASATSDAGTRVEFRVAGFQHGAPSSAQSQQPFVFSASGRQLIQDAQTGQLHIISPHLQLQQTPPEPVSNPSPVQVISWDPSRPWRGPAHQPARLGSPCTCKVSCGARIILFFFFFLGGMDTHYKSATIATSRVREVHTTSHRGHS